MATRRSKLTIQEDTAVVIPEGEPAYWLLITDADCEGLRVGRVTLDLRRRATAMLSWKEDQELLDEEEAARVDGERLSERQDLPRQTQPEIRE